MHQPALADELAVRIEREPAIVAPTLGRLPLPVSHQPLERLRHRRVTTTGQLDLKIVIECPQFR